MVCGCQGSATSCMLLSEETIDLQFCTGLLVHILWLLFLQLLYLIVVSNDEFQGKIIGLCCYCLFLLIWCQYKIHGGVKVVIITIIKINLYLYKVSFETTMIPSAPHSLGIKLVFLAPLR